MCFLDPKYAVETGKKQVSEAHFFCCGCSFLCSGELRVRSENMASKRPEMAKRWHAGGRAFEEPNRPGQMLSIPKSRRIKSYNEVPRKLKMQRRGVELLAVSV